MNCEHCGGETQVINSRPQVTTIYRRRECLVCHKRFSTNEVRVYDKTNELPAFLLWLP